MQVMPSQAIYSFFQKRRFLFLLDFWKMQLLQNRVNLKSQATNQATIKQQSNSNQAAIEHGNRNQAALKPHPHAAMELQSSCNEVEVR